MQTRIEKLFSSRTAPEAQRDNPAKVPARFVVDSPLPALQATADASPRVSQLRALQAAADACATSKSLDTLQTKADAFTQSGTPASNNAKQMVPIQQKAATESSAVQKTSTQLQPEIAPQTNNTGLPDNLKTGIESLSGMDMGNVQVHYNSSKPAQLNAHAYAQGADIHLGPGQEKHLPHEAWHVVQQAQGRVQPTLLMKEKLPVNDDPALEQEADVMGAKAIQMHSAPSANAPATNSKNRSGSSPTSPVVQCVGGEKIAFAERTQNIALWRGAQALDVAIEEMKESRHQRKIAIWADIGNRENKDNISSAYSDKLEELSDDLALIQNTKPFTAPNDPLDILSIQGNQVIYRNQAIATVKKGKNAFDRSQDHDAARPVYKKGPDGDSNYITDSRGTITRRYAYVEKNYWQFMEFLHTSHMEGRYQKLIRASGAGGQRPDVRNSDSDIVSKVKRGRKQKGDLTNEQLAFVHQYWGSGAQQRGLSLTSTPKPGVTIGNGGDNFRTDDGFRIKIDLAKMAADGRSPILLNHYAQGGVKDAVQDDAGEVNTNPLGKASPYKYESSVTKNRELYLEFLKPEWIVEIEHHPRSGDLPGEGESTTFTAADFRNTNEYMKNLRGVTGGDEYGIGFKMALEKKAKPRNASDHLGKGYSSGESYLQGYQDGQNDIADKADMLRGQGDSRVKKRGQSSRQINKSKQESSKNAAERSAMLVANQEIENEAHADATDIYRVGYVHGRLGRDKVKNLSDIMK